MSSKDVGKPLTIDLIFTKTKSDSLQNIKNLNLWGNDLQDLKLIQKMPNLEVVSLSVNRITSLKDFLHCTKLQELYLRKNNITDLNQIKYLIKLPNLKVLWLHDNPCAQQPNYRQIVIRNLPHLIKLDNSPVNSEDRIAAQQKIKDTIDYEQQTKYPQIETGEVNEQEQQRWSSKQSGSRYKQKLPQSSIKQEQKWSKNNNNVITNHRNSSSSSKNKQFNKGLNQQVNRNQNILMAVLSLMRQLDQGSLEIIRRQAQTRLN